MVDELNDTVRAKRAEDRRKLIETVDAFATEMKAKLLNKHNDGFTGWDINTFIDSHRCERMLMEHMRRLCHGQRQEIDIANLAMFIWARKETPDDSTP